MQNNQLITTLAALPRKKVTRFKEFANSPYFNKHADVTNLLDYLSNIYPNYTDKKCHRETIFKILYPSLPHDQQKLAIVFTYSMRLFEDFFRTEEALKKGTSKDNALLTAHLREYDLLFLLPKYVEENIRRGNDIHRKNLHAMTPTIYDLQYLAEQDALAVRLTIFDKPYLEKKQELLDVYYLSEKLKDACELLQRGKIFNRDFIVTPLFEATAAWVRKEGLIYFHYPSIGLFFDLLELLKTNDAKLYEPLLNTLVKVEPTLSQDELKAVFSHLQNFCIGQINVGRREYLVKLFQIYRSQMDRELLLVNSLLPEWHYKNIVTTALRLDEHEWAKDFIMTNKEKLRKEVQENAYSFNLAAYHYHLGHFGEVLKLLLQVEYTDLRYNLDAKSLLLRTYYDLEEEEALISLTDAFRQFLKRNKEMTNFQKTGYYNLLKFTRSAFRLKIGRGIVNQLKWQSSLARLKENIDHAETVFNLGWLQGKIEELH